MACPLRGFEVGIENFSQLSSRFSNVSIFLSRQRGSALSENIQILCVALLVAFFIRTFVVQAFKIPSGSMLPTLQIGDYIFVNKFVYGIKIPFTRKTLIPIGQPRVNDIIVFQYPPNPKLDYIKRVIAISGDVVEIRDKQVFVNKKPFVDPYAHFEDPVIRPANLDHRDNFGPITVPANSLFVMGDNRDNSQDSRFWGFVRNGDVRGKAWRVYWSWDIDQPLLSLGRLSSIRWARFGRAVHNKPPPPRPRPVPPPPPVTATPEATPAPESAPDDAAPESATSPEPGSAEKTATPDTLAPASKTPVSPEPAKEGKKRTRSN